MAGYVDGYLLVVPKNKVAEYKKMAQEGKRAWMKHGALAYMECKGEDMRPKTPGSKPKYFPALVGAKPNETVWFSYIVYKSRKHRDQVMKKVNAEMEKKYAGQEEFPMPFDMKRFSYGGFTVEVGT